MSKLHRIVFVLLLGACTQGNAAPANYFGILSGANESPANASPGGGFALVVIDSTAHTLSVNISFYSLAGTTTASHIHCCVTTAGIGNAGVATQTPTFSGFPLGVTSGSYPTTVFDLTQASSWNPAFVTTNGGTTAGAEAVLVAGIIAGKAYLNIHSTVYPGGEIRAFLKLDEIFGSDFEVH